MARTPHIPRSPGPARGTVAIAAICALAWLGIASPAGRAAPAGSQLRAQVRAYRQQQRGAILQELRALLALPNVATDSSAIRRNANHLVELLAARGISTRLLDSPGSPPAVLGELRTPGARRTIVFYAHYDGQPVTAAEWTTPPWEPVLRDNSLEAGGTPQPWPAPGATAPAADGEFRIYARSASDDKGPIVALLTAVDALRNARVKPSVNLKFFFEGEEEQGSPHAAALLTAHRAELAADAWIFCDGPVDPTRRPQVVFGVRGVMGAEFTVYGPARPLHSGHYGNWAPNPIALLADLLSSLRAPDGHILIEGFYDDVVPPSASELEAIARLPDAESGLRQELALGRTEGDGQRLMLTLMGPALNFRGLQSGAVGERAANQIPSEARASIDFRLVPNQTPERVRERVETYLRGLGCTVVHEPPSAQTKLEHERVVLVQWGAGYPAYRAALDAPVSQAVVAVAQQALHTDVLAVPSLGGSLPMSTFHDVLQVPLITVPMVNHDNRQHAQDENLRLQNLWDGIELYAGLMAELGKR